MSLLKKLKEDFVSDLSGGSIEEVYLVTSIALTSDLAFKLIHGAIELPLVYDYVLNVLAILTAITLYANNSLFLHYSILLPSLIIYLTSHYVTANNNKKNKNTNKGKKEKKTAKVSKDSSAGTTREDFLPRKNFVTIYRAHMLIVTNLAILAVDFKVFPRRFAKVETWGTSMMDMGVGSFVFSMGLVSSRQLIKQGNRKGIQKFNLSQYCSIVWQNLFKSLPILTLGVARLLSVKQLQYQEHTTEYGIHWNFFITLGSIPVLMGVLDPILNKVPRGVLAFAFALVNELVLQKTDVLSFIITNDNRFDNWITMNKEGIYSLWGYFTIFLFGQSFGSFVLTGYPTKDNLVLYNNKTATTAATTTSKKKKNKDRSLLTVTTTQGLITTTIFYQLVFTLVNNSPLITNVSRRFCNLAYILWVVSYNSTFLLGYNVIDKFVSSSSLDRENSYLLESINNNGLLIFLVGNLLTGLVNMSVNTLEMSNMGAILVLMGYSVTWSAMAIYLNKHKIYIKL
ncbi:uncharacterized protein LODBEIA_P01060 [Lodderomyces beijingensis]|uniref:GPI-anchored wall transfer protein n=1 Tax=Lodderomyces beijingensis TaxID=1775926 RepID=A0ABP0ZI78_9ASCO